MMAWSFSNPVSRRTVGGVLNVGAASELTIAAGVVTVTRSSHTIDTEADAASDDLVTINGLEAGGVYVLRVENPARSVKLKKTGNIDYLSGPEVFLETVIAFSPDGATCYLIM